MGILSRFTRMAKADIHGVMDQLEDKKLVLAQCLREMRDEITKTEAVLKENSDERETAARREEEYAARARDLDRDLDRAVEKERDDLAKILIRKADTLSRRREELSRHRENLERRIAGLERDLEEKRLAREKLKLEADRYLQNEKWNVRISGIPGQGDDLDRSGLSREEVEMELERRKEAARERRAS